MTNPELFLRLPYRIAEPSLNLTSDPQWKYKLHPCVDILPTEICLYSQPTLGKGVCSVSLNPCPMIGSDVKVIPLPLCFLPQARTASLTLVEMSIRLNLKA